jgi:S-(hydroxymethyl)glutathione dehydrogenase/alcohol dehydrogenase
MNNFIKAAVLDEINKPLKIKFLKNEDLLIGQVLVKVYYSGVCRSQLMEIKGARGIDSWLPHLLGHEGTGEVLDVGEGVTKVKKGDKVILGWIKGEGLDAPGAKYKCNGEVINSGKVTTFSTHTIVSENRLVKIPNGLPLDVAVLFGCALLTGAGMVFNQLKPEQNKNIAVLGLGGIGLSALMALNLYNCKSLIAIDVNDEKLKLAKEFGATHCINAAKKNVIEVVNMITENEGADGCIESGGKVETIETGLALINNTGKLVFASHPPNEDYIKIKPHDLIIGKQIIGSWGGASSPDLDIKTLAEIYMQGKFPLQKLINKRYKLEEINQALEDLENGTAFRPIIEMYHDY